MFQKYKFQIYLLFVVLLCYWPFTFFHSALLYDNIDVALPTKYFAGSCLQNGMLPLWNPYQIFGFPAHADLQYTNWNIEVFIIGLTRGYDYATLHILYMFYLYLGSLGMFLLIKYVSKNSLPAFYIATVYILSGLFTAHSQSLVTILGLVWLPYVILYFLKWLDEPSLKTSLLTAVFFYLLFTMGYQAFAFMILPVFFCLLVLKLIQNFKKKERRLLQKHILFGCLIIISIVLLLSPVLISQLQSRPFVSRLNGLSLEDVMFKPFPPFSLVSCINPILTIGNDALFKTDVSMRNLFMGLIPLMLIIISLLKKNKTAYEYVLLFFAGLFLFASFGDYTPVREILYYVFPGFNLFRFPSLIRIAAMLCLIIYFAGSWKYSLKQLFYNQKIKLELLGGFLLTTLCLTIFSFSKTPAFSFFGFKSESFNYRITQSSPYEIAFYFGLFQVAILAGTLLLLNTKINFKLFCKRLYLITFIEMACTILIYGQYTAFSNVKPGVYQENFNKLQPYFPAPSKDAIAANKVKFNYVNGFWKNTGCFKKQAMPDDEYTSFSFINYNTLSDYRPNLKDSLISYPFIYFSKQNAEEYLIKSDIDTTVKRLESSFHFRNAEAEYKYSEYNPTHIVVHCDAEKDLVLNLQQSYYNGWSAEIDSKPAALLWNASLLMSVELTKGKHTVEFIYADPVFEYSLMISYGALFIILITLVFLCRLLKSKKLLLCVFLTLFSISLLFLMKTNAQHTNSTSENTFTFTDKNQKTKQFKSDFSSKSNYRDFWNLCDTIQPVILNYSWGNFYNSPEFLHSINYNSADKVQSVKSGSMSISNMNKPVTKLLFDDLYNSVFPDKKFIDTTNNDYSMILNSKQNPYSKSELIDPIKLMKKNIYGFVKLRTAKGANAVAVCSIKHKDGREEQKYFALNKYLIEDNTYQKVFCFFETEKSIFPGDEIKLFIMNQTKKNVFLKEFNCVYYQ